jgi:hypothetical protein
METTTTNERHLIQGAMAGGIGLSQVLREDAHCLQDIASDVRVLRDPQDGWHAKIHQNLQDVPCQLAGLGDAFHLGIVEELLDLDELHQLFMIIPGVESLGLRLCQHCLV